MGRWADAAGTGAGWSPNDEASAEDLEGASSFALGIFSLPNTCHLGGIFITSLAAWLSHLVLVDFFKSLFGPSVRGQKNYSDGFMTFQKVFSSDVLDCWTLL